MRTIINLGNADTDPKVIQAAALTLIQFKDLLRISEAQNLRLADIKYAGSGQWQVNIKKSKTDQGSRGALVAFRFSEAEAALWSKYIFASRNTLSEVGQQRKRSTWEFIKLMLCRLGVGAH
ncbi:hypothetical protein GCK32_011036 [Trichostrongylus colubriformis]|uniref:Tyr recombinase domain-containing protein n=1 Tax=Trichostrongylus colubriformis TaxID=6319 RepID=A0AAN8EXP8_TRICO